MSLIRSMIRTFIYVTAGDTIGAAIFISLFNRDYQFSYGFLWQLIAVAAVCSLGNIIYYSRKELSKRQMKIRHVLHYLYNNLTVVGGGLIFQWIGLDQIQFVIFLSVLFAVIYTCISAAMFRSDEKTAQDLNKKLRKYNEEDE